MSHKYTITLDDQFKPKTVEIDSSECKMSLQVGDGLADDNNGGGGLLTVTRKSDGELITMYLPKSAVAAIKEVFRNG